MSTDSHIFRNPIARSLKALQFFTILPLPSPVARQIDHEEDFALAVPYFSIAGLLVGIVIGLVWHISASMFPHIVAAGLTVLSGIIITGALHEDGLADCADGLGGRRPEKTLEIMRDSAIGTYGTVALIGSVGLRWACLAAIETDYVIYALLIAHCVSRAAIITPIRFSTYVRKQGAGSLVSSHVNEFEMLAGLFFAAIIAMVFGGWIGLITFFVAAIAAIIVLAIMENRIGGYTGDVLGAVQQLAEISMFITFAAFWISQ